MASVATLPRDASGRLYHIGLAPGEASNLVILVGEERRARLFTRLMENVVEIRSERGFTTFNGTFSDKKMTVMSIGMGMPMMDFCVRELRAIVSGPIAIIRFGTCGVIKTNVSDILGCLAVCDGGSAILQHDVNDESCEVENAYRLSRVWPPDRSLTDILMSCCKQRVGESIVHSSVNVSADSFYGSQGRKSVGFNDCNEGLLDMIRARLAAAETITMEMETGQLMHVAGKHVQDGGLRVAAVHLVVADRIRDAFMVETDAREAMEVQMCRPLLETLAEYHDTILANLY